MRSFLVSYPVLLLVLISVASTLAWIPSHRINVPTQTPLTQHAAAPITLDGKEIRAPLTPLGNLVLVRVKDTLTATGGGILLPDQSKERPTEGVVVEAGPGKIHPLTGVRIENPIKPGVSVLYGKFDGRPLEYQGDECQVIRDDDVLLYYTGVSMKVDTVTPVRDYVLVKIDENKYGDKPLQTKSGVVIASQVVKDDAPCEGVVIKVGEGRMASNGKLTTPPVQSGDYVKFKDYAGNGVMIEGKPFSVVKMGDILCTLSEAEKEEILEDLAATAAAASEDAA